MSYVHHVKQKVGLGKFFQGGPEGGYHGGRQLLDETDGVGQEQRGAGGQSDAPGHRVKGGEQLVRGFDFGGAQGVE